MAEITNILNDENTNNQQENVQTTPTEPNIELQKDTQKFLQQIDSIINIPNQPANQQKNTTNNNNINNPTNQNSNNSDTQNANDLKVRIVKKNSLDGDVNAGLRNPVSDSTQVRVVEKNNLQTDVIASLRDPVTDYRGTEEIKIFSAIQNQTPAVIKPNMTISSSTVEEGSKAVFNVHFDKASNKIYNVSFNLSTNRTAQTEDINTTFIVKDSKGNEISKNPDGTYSVPLGETNLKVEVQTRNDNSFEGNETFELNGKTEFMNSNIQGIGTIVDDGSLSNGLNDDRPLTVSSVTVNEGSPYAVFTVSGAAGQLASLNLANQNNDGSDLISLEYFNGTTWTSYSSGNVALDSNGKLLVRVALSPEQDSVLDGPETFNLVATNTSGISASGLGTIVDDGTGSYFAQNNNTGISNVPNGIILDNDKPTLTLSDATVEEGSTISFAGSLSNPSEYAEEITLSTSLTTAESNDFNSDKTTWTVTYTVSNSAIQTLNVDSNGKFTLPAGITSFNVNIPTTDDSIYEGAETFTLSANASSSYITDSDTAIGTIKDDGTATDGDDTGTTIDNDITKFSIADAEAYEGANNTITFTVTRIGDAEATQTIDYNATIETGNSAETGDFTGTLSGTLTFLTGENSKTITLNVPVDADSDEDTFTVTLSNNSSGSSILDGTAIGTIKESNTPPEGTDKTIALGKNTTYVLSASDFGYSDANNDTFSKVKITTLETNGKLLYFDTTSSTWKDVTQDLEILKTSIDNGYLIFKPNLNEIGVPYTTFEFSVNDGTAYDLLPNVITYNIGNTLSVSNPLPVDEGKSAIFTISLDESRASDTLLDLSVGGVNSSSDYDNTLYYKKIAPDGQSWSWEVATGNQVTIAQGQTSVEIKVKTLSDAVADNAEPLILTATINDDTADMVNTSAVGSTTINDYPSLIIDTKPNITEGDFAVFEVSLSSPKSTDTVITLGGGGTATWGVDYSQNYEYSTDDGLTWQTISNFSVSIPGSSTTTPSVLIRTQTTNDGVSEPDETITLIATTTDTGISTKTVSTTTTIVDKVNLTVYEDGNDTNLSAQANSVTLSATSEYTYTILGQGVNGTVTQSGNNLIYTPNTDFSGSDSFTYIRTNLSTGLEISGSANVTVNANADTPIININLNNKVLSTGTNILINGNLDSALSTNNGTDGNWYGKQSPGNSGKSITASQDKTLTQVVDSGTDKSVSLSGEWMIQNIRVPLAQDNATYSVTFTITGTGTDGQISWIGNIANGATEVVIASGLSAGTYTYSIPASATIGSDTTYNALVFTGNSIKIDDVSLISNSSNNYTYDVNISNSLVDIDGSETLSSVTISGVPTGATFNHGTNNNDGTWTFTQAQLSGLKITTTSTSFTLTSIVHSIDGSSTSPNATDTITINNTNLLPLIGDQTLNVTNGSVNTNGSNISTTYGDGTNIFSWDPSKTQIPELYANGQKVVITYDNVNHTVTGTIDNGATNIFTTTITMADSNGTTLNYTQGSELLGVANILDGDIILPGGGNQDYRVFQFTDSNSSSIVDALVYAHNLIEDTPAEIASLVPEHTVNTNNYYIGVDSNNMNAGQQLIFDFATVGTYDTTTTHANEVSEINIKLFNFGSVKSGDELYITVITKDPAHAGQTIRENILLTQDSDYTSELEYTVRSTTGNPIVGVEFLAGNNSSFKLGIESIGSINYHDTFKMKYAYDITDATGDTDNGLTTIQVGTGTINTSLDYTLDSKIIFDATDKTIDGGTGTDTLILGTGIDINFDSYTNSIKNIEKIDLTNSSATNDLSNIKLQDVIDMTDSNNLLTILGDGDGTAPNSDSVILKSESSKVWTLASNDATYNNYVNSGDNSISLKIDKDIHVSII